MRIFQPTVTGSNTTTGSLHISGPVYFYTLETSSVSHILTYNTSSGQVFYTASEAIGRRPGNPTQSIQFNSGSEFSGSGNFTFDFNNNIVYLTGSMFVSGAISASFGENTVGFYGTASWAQSASQAISSSYALTASLAGTASFASTSSAAPSDTYVQYNKNGILGAEEYFRYIYTSHSLQQGNQVTAPGEYSHAEGRGTTALGYSSHAEGEGTVAEGQFSHAEGDSTKAEGYGSHAEGYKTTSSGQYSHTEGFGSITLGDHQLAIGQYNVALTSQSAFIIGDGTDDSNRHNLLFASKSHFEVSASNVFFQGLSEVTQPNILVYNTASGQVYYTSSFGGSPSANVFSLPVPKVILYNSSSTPGQVYENIQSYNPSTGGAGATNAKLYNNPRVITMDITDEMRATHRIFVELVHFKRARRKGGQSYFIPPSHIDSGGGVYINKLAADLGVPLSSRGGKQKWRTNPNVVPAVFADIQVDRPNHYEVTARNQTIPVYEYLNGWFVKGPITYANTSGGESTFSSWYPSYRGSVGNSPTGRFAYGAIFSPMYVAFRYIAWDASANGGLGAFISGPLSPIVVIGPQIFPFVQDPISTLSLGWPTAYLTQTYIDLPGSYNDNLKCWFVNRLP